MIWTDFKPSLFRVDSVKTGRLAATKILLIIRDVQMANPNWKTKCFTLNYTNFKSHNAEYIKPYLTLSYQLLLGQ